MTKSSKKTFLYTIFAFIAVSAVLGYGYKNYLQSKVALDISPHKLIVAITQIAPHPSLDAIHQGVVDELESQKIENLEIIFQDAQGSVSTAAQIAQKFASLDPAVIVPITTPSAQSAYAVAKPRKIPVVFAAVSDPVAAKLISDFDKVGDGITGVYDQAPFEEHAKLIYSLLKDKKESLTIGILYNPGEANSVSAIESISKALTPYNIKVIKAAASSTTTVAAATQSLIGKVDAIYIPNDNTVISALDSVIKVTHAEKIPVFSSDPESVERGCLATIAPDQYQIGRQTGRMVVSLLKGTEISKINPEKASALVFVLNQKTARHLGITFPHTLIEKADKIIELDGTITTNL